MLPMVFACALALAGWTGWLVHRAGLPRWWYGVAGAASLAVLGLAIVTLIRLADAGDTGAAPAERQRELDAALAAAYAPMAIAIAVLGAWLAAMVGATLWLRRRGRLR